MSIKVLLLGDSVPFPRHTREQTLEVSWPNLLQECPQIKFVWQRARGGSMISDIKKEILELGAYFGQNRSFDVTLIQIGIVDCCPRPFPRFIQNVLARIPGGTPVQKWINANYGLCLRFYNRAWISEGAFRRTLADCVALSQGLSSTTAFIRIGPPANRLARQIPGVKDAVDRYNEIIREVTSTGGAGYIDPYQSRTEPIEELFLADGHHLSDKGHQRVLASVLDFIQGLTGKRDRAFLKTEPQLS